ncbi:MAG: hypothetical protein RQ751_09260 [Longimicrobiales bacterium]|nr:hypothetical protein [Longimicrobiales bacterium]
MPAVWLDDRRAGAEMSALGISATPTWVFVDGDGIVRGLLVHDRAPPEDLVDRLCGSAWTQ